MITGQVDLIIEKEDHISIYDWKTSSKPQVKSWGLQASAYRFLAFNHYDKVVVFHMVHLDKKGKEAKEIEVDAYQFPLFLKLLEIYRFFEMDKTRGTK